MQAEKTRRPLRRVKRPAGQPATMTQYLDREFGAKRKNEYVNGEIRPMAYTSEEHCLIVANLIILLGVGLKGTDCRVYPSDRMLHVPEFGSFYYPDVMVVCGESEFFQYKQNMKATLNPVVLIEVLSKTTSDFDETVKWHHYRRISTLRQYVRVSQHEVSVEVYNRIGESTDWLNSEFNQPEQTVTINGVSVLVADVYAHINGLMA